MSSAQGGGRRKSRRRVRLEQPARLSGLLFLPLILAAALIAGWLGPLPSAQAQGWQYEDAGAVRRVVVTLYKSRTLRLDKPFASAVVGSPEIVDALPMSDRALYIQGKKVGTTNVSVFDQGMKLIGIIDVEVAVDTGNLQEKIRASSGSGGIRVGSSSGQIVLSGVAENAVAADRAVAVAKSLAPEGGSIVNAMKIAPAQQVMLRVRFLEVARSAGREIGVNWFGANNGGSRGINTGIGVAQPLGRPRRDRGRRGRKSCNAVPRPPGLWDFRDFALRCIALRRCDRQSRQQWGEHRCCPKRTGNEGPHPPPGGAGSGCALRRHRGLPGGRRISGPFSTTGGHRQRAGHND